jgi:hypothetical protein
MTVGMMAAHESRQEGLTASGPQTAAGRLA